MSMPRNQMTSKLKRQIPMRMLRQRFERHYCRLIRYCRLTRCIP